MQLQTLHPDEAKKPGAGPTGAAFGRHRRAAAGKEKTEASEKQHGIGRPEPGLDARTMRSAASVNWRGVTPMTTRVDLNGSTPFATTVLSAMTAALNVS